MSIFQISKTLSRVQNQAFKKKKIHSIYELLKLKDFYFHREKIQNFIQNV